MKASESIQRTSEIEDPTNLYFIHPIARRLTFLFAKLHLSPNVVSLTGMLFGLLAGLSYYHYQNLQCTIAGFILMIAWHIMDGADGQLARLTQTQSQSGKIIDGICDYVTFIAVYTALGLALSQTSGVWIWAVIAAAGLCHAVQAAAYEVQRQEYNFWGRGQESAELPTLDDLRALGVGGSLAQRILNQLYGLYIRVQWLVAGVALDSRKELAAMIERAPQRAPFIRQEYRRIFAPAVCRWGVLSANYRTFGIFIAALLKSPQYYFWFEIIGFSAIMITLIARQRARYKLFSESLETEMSTPRRCEPPQ